VLEIVMVGTSWGGLSAVSALLTGLPASFQLPMIIVQHRHRASDGGLRQILQERTTLRVCDVEDKAPITPGYVYIAPPDYHTLIDRDLLSLSTDPPVRYSRPSIDVTFISGADAFGARAIGVILTGANEDGAQGLRRVVDRGGRAIVQDPLTAESPTMPRAALGAVRTARVLRLEEIAPELVRLAGAGNGEWGTGRRAPGLGSAPPVGEGGRATVRGSGPERRDEGRAT
jgi:two-component system chemotaxis response regulator CheB